MRDEKYPGLYAGAKANGIHYITALQRVRKGMSIEEAVTKPVRCYGGRSGNTKPEGTTVTRLSKRAIKIAQGWVPGRKRGRPVKVPGPRKDRMAHVGNAPDHIRILREAYCAEFIKRGTLDPTLFAKLKVYADAHKQANRDLRRVPTEHSAHDQSGGPAASRDDGGRNDPRYEDGDREEGRQRLAQSGRDHTGEDRYDTRPAERAA